MLGLAFSLWKLSRQKTISILSTVAWEKYTYKPVSFFHCSRFNRLSVDSVDESSFSHLSSLQVLDIGTGSTDLPFKMDEMDGDKMTEEKQET